MATWNILYIDDSEAELTAAAASLAARGHRVATRTGPLNLDEELQNADLVIIDYHMGGMNGREILKVLRRKLERSDKSPQFFLYTSDADVGADYRELGFDGRFILKGNQEALQKQVDAAMRVAQLRTLRPSR